MFAARGHIDTASRKQHTPDSSFCETNVRSCVATLSAEYPLLSCTNLSPAVPDLHGRKLEMRCMFRLWSTE